MRGTSNSDWARHTDLSAGSVGPSRGSADCARRSPGDASKDAGSIPATSTTADCAEILGGSRTGPRTGVRRAVRCRAGSVGRTSPGRGAHATLGPSHAGPVAKSHPAVRRPRHQRVVSGANDASTTAAEDVTRGRPTARSRTGCRCASRTAGRSCRPDSRAARRPGVAGRRSEIRTGTAVASESWADARSRRFRREGAYGPARQACAAGAGVLMSRSMGSLRPGPCRQRGAVVGFGRAGTPNVPKRPTSGFRTGGDVPRRRRTSCDVRRAVVRPPGLRLAPARCQGPWVVSPARLHSQDPTPWGPGERPGPGSAEKAGATADSGGPGLRFPARDIGLPVCSAAALRASRALFVETVRPHTCRLRPSGDLAVPGAEAMNSLSPVLSWIGPRSARNTSSSGSAGRR